MTNKDLIKIGFKTLPHFAIGNSINFHLERRRFLSASGVGTPNEFLYIYEVDLLDSKKITDIICLHNYDYNGALTLKKVKGIIKYLTL